MYKFYIDEFNNKEISYKDLVEEVNKHRLNKYVYYKEPLMVFLSMIKALVYGKEIILLDGDWSEQELQNQGIKLIDIYEKEYAIGENLLSLEDLYSRIEVNKDKFSVSLYTSGTTSKPKKIKHRYSRAGRAIRKGDKYRKDVWLFTYNPTHFAGLQVFLQAFLNRNTIIIANDIKKYNIEIMIEKYNVTKISATPTFYRYMSFDTDKTHNNVSSITLGGEKSDSNLIERLKIKFPLAKINNIYASTEGGNLFASRGETFVISDNIKNLVKVENNELLLHKDLIGEFDNYMLENDWYRTGDTVEVINDNEIKFTNRKGDFINIGGYKANPIEIEEEIMKIENVIDVVVYPIPNNVLGNIIGAKIVIREVEYNIQKRIINELKQKLQNWKIPRIIKVVDAIDKTNTGKKVRK